MIKKILVTLILFIFFTSCGKKGDPVYNGKTHNTQNVELKVSYEI